MTASNFTTTVLPFTLRYEGGRADNPRDPGGRTNQGVTQRTFTAWLARRGRARRDVYLMTSAERDAIYRGSYWDAVKGDTLPDGVDLALFDYGVNSGPARALRAWGRRSSNEAASGVRQVCAARLSFDRGLAVWNTFRRGWTARVAGCEALGVKMAEHAGIGVPPEAPATPATATKLAVESRSAAARAQRHGRKAKGALALSGAGAAAQTPAAPAGHLPVAAVAVLGLLMVTTIALLLWRAHQQEARAKAYNALAKEAAAPQPAAPRPAGR